MNPQTLEVQALTDKLVKIAVFLNLSKDTPNCRYLALGMLQDAGEAYKALNSDSQRLIDLVINDSDLF